MRISCSRSMGGPGGYFASSKWSQREPKYVSRAPGNVFVLPGCCLQGFLAASGRFCGCLSRSARIFHDFLGNPWKSWKIMVFHGKSWFFMKIHGFHAKPWFFMEIHVFHENPWFIVGVLRPLWARPPPPLCAGRLHLRVRALGMT